MGMRGELLIVSRAEHLAEHKQIADEFGVAFEINDFFHPSVLDDERKQEELIQLYEKTGLPKNSTMHGAFLDVAVFSEDQRIREISQLRMLQSMQIARRLGVKGVVFHTNYNPFLSSQSYQAHLVNTTSAYLERLLETYADIEIYVENMFDTTPDILAGISERLGHYKNYGVCLDWAHVNTYGHAQPEYDKLWVNRLHSYVKHLHINDNDLLEDLHLPLGEGKIDWDKFFDYYAAYFQTCSMLIETNDPDGQRTSLKYIREKFHL